MAIKEFNIVDYGPFRINVIEKLTVINRLMAQYWPKFINLSFSIDLM